MKKIKNWLIRKLGGVVLKELPLYHQMMIQRFFKGIVDDNRSHRCQIGTFIRDNEIKNNETSSNGLGK